MSNSHVETTTLIVKKVIDILFFNNPLGTSMGVLIGLILHGLLVAFLPFLKTLTIIHVESIKIYHLVALGVFLFNFRLGLLLGKKYNPEIDEKISRITEAKTAGQISKAEAKLQYKNVIRNYINSNISSENVS